VVDGFLEWMGSREGRQCIEVRDVLWDLLDDLELDAKQRQLIWPDAERLDLVQSISASRNCTRTSLATRSRKFYSTGSIWATIRKTIPRRNSTSLTASQSDGSPTISETPTPQKHERKLVTLEIYRWWLIVTNLVLFYFASRIILRSQNVA
jgi:hypothetical protein